MTGQVKGDTEEGAAKSEEVEKMVIFEAKCEQNQTSPLESTLQVDVTEASSQNSEVKTISKVSPDEC